MAIAQPSSTIAGSGAAAAQTTGSLAVPSGMVQDDFDLLVLAIENSGSNSTVTTPAGYQTPIINDNLDFANGIQGRLWASWRIAPASPAAVTINWDDPTYHQNRRWYAGRLRFTGVDTASPIDATGSIVEEDDQPGTSPTMTLSAATSATDNAWALAFFAWASGFVPSPFYAASGWTATPYNNFGSFEDTISGVLLTKALGAAGSTGTCVIDPTNNASAGVRNWLGRIITLKADPAAVSATRRPIVVIM